MLISNFPWIITRDNPTEKKQKKLMHRSWTWSHVVPLPLLFGWTIVFLSFPQNTGLVQVGFRVWKTITFVFGNCFLFRNDDSHYSVAFLRKNVSKVLLNLVDLRLSQTDFSRANQRFVLTIAHVTVQLYFQAVSTPKFVSETRNDQNEKQGKTPHRFN